MADVKICDRCRKELTVRQTIIKLRPIRYILGVEVYSRYPDYLQRKAAHSFDLCDDCANGLAEFLGYIPDSNMDAVVKE